MVTVQTSKGALALTAAEHALLERVLAGTTGMAESQALYQCVSGRGLPFPLEWEASVLRNTLVELPERHDLLQRLALVEATLRGGRATAVPAATASGDALAWDAAWERFSRSALIGHVLPEAVQRGRAECFADACTLLSNPHFDTLPVARRAGTILALHDTLMSAPSADLVVVADLGLRQLRRMLLEPALTEAQAMGVYDALHSLYFAGVTDVTDLRRFDGIVPAFERWLVDRHERGSRQPVAAEGPLNVAYLLHTAHFDRGNAVSPLLVALVDLHARMPARTVFLYLVQYVGPTFIADLGQRPFTVRAFPQGRDYSRLDEIAASLRSDHIDVVITEQNRSIAAVLFTRRVAPLQLFADTGFPYWSLHGLDWTLSPVDTGGATPRPRRSLLAWRQSAADLTLHTDSAAIAAVRADFPDHAFVLGVFVRLVKLTDRFFDLLAELLAGEPAFHLVIAGTGDPTSVWTFINGCPDAERVRFINENVDLNVYGQVIDVMCDTFPFIGGNACREVASHGTPVVAMLGTPWDALLHQDRSADLLARDGAEYVGRVRRLYRDPQFRAEQRERALEIFRSQTDPRRMVDEVEAGIRSALIDARSE